MKLENAMTFALDAFGDSLRDGPVKLPAFWHSCDVVTILSFAGITEEKTLSLAYLHDVLEDTNAKLEKAEAWPHDYQLRHAGCTFDIGDQLATDLKQMTNPQHMDKADRKAIELMMAARLSQRAARVRIADKMSNARSLMFDRPTDWKDERVRDYLIWARQVVEACAVAANHATLVVNAHSLFDGVDDKCLD